MRMFANRLNSSKNIIGIILLEYFDKSKVCARCVPHESNEDQNCERVFHEKQKRISLINHIPYSSDI